MSNRHVMPSAVDVLERVLDKGIVIDVAVRVSVVGIDLASLEARVVVASLETYLKYVPRLAGGASGRAGSDASADADREQDALAVQIMREAFAALNGHDLGRYAALLDDGYVSETHGRPVMVRGREAGSHALDMYFKVLPDFHFIIEGAVAAHDDVLVSWLATGTPRAEYRRAGLTTRPLQVPGCTVTRIRDGKIVHAWNYWDTPTRGE